MNAPIQRNPPEWAQGPYEYIWHSLCRERFFQLSEKAQALLTSPQPPDMQALRSVLYELSNLEAPTSKEDTFLSKLFQRLFIRAEIRTFGSIMVDVNQKDYIIALAALSAVAVSKHILLTDPERLMEWLLDVLSPKKRKRDDGHEGDDPEELGRSFEDQIWGYLRGS